jgi:hypothetical protein
VRRAHTVPPSRRHIAPCEACAHLRTPDSTVALGCLALARCVCVLFFHLHAPHPPTCARRSTRSTGHSILPDKKVDTPIPYPPRAHRHPAPWACDHLRTLTPLNATPNSTLHQGETRPSCTTLPPPSCSLWGVGHAVPRLHRCVELSRAILYQRLSSQNLPGCARGSPGRPRWHDGRRPCVPSFASPSWRGRVGGR